ncbi:hypothetical protein ACFL03_15670 [Thermodesulfobacteriota bacterium]
MKEAIKRKRIKSLVRFGWIITSPLLILSILLILNTINPMAYMYMHSFQVVNRSGETVYVTPVGTHIGTGSRFVLAQYAIEMPAIPVFKQGNFILGPDQPKKIVFDRDDISPSEILIRANNGSYKQIAIDPQSYAVTDIPSLSDLPNANSVVMDAAIGSEYNWIYWAIIFSGLLPLYLYIWRRRLTKTAPNKSFQPIDDASG